MTLVTGDQAVTFWGVEILAREYETINRLANIIYGLTPANHGKGAEKQAKKWAANLAVGELRLLRNAVRRAVGEGAIS